MLSPSYIEALEHLRRVVAALPSSVPAGHPSGIVNRCFRVKPSERVKDPWTVTSDAYARCFAESSNTTKHGLDNISRGRFGMDRVVSFFEELTTCPGVSTSDLLRIEQKIRQIAELVDKKVRLLTSDELGLAATSPVKLVSGQVSLPECSEHEPSDSAHDTAEDFTHLLGDEDVSEGSSEGEERSKAARIRPQMSSANPSAAYIRPGPQDSVRQWALSHFSAPIPGEFEDRREPAWLFTCKYCGIIRRVHRTLGCEIIEHEPLPISASNLAKHLRKECKKIPQAESWEAAQARNQPSVTQPAPNAASLSLGAMFASEIVVPPPPPTALSKVVFRSTLIQGIVRDTFPLTFGEGEGMKQVFKLVNPLVSLPSHHTSRRDLDALFQTLLGRFKRVMQEQTSRVALTSDAWSSKSSVYSISGALVTFIDKYWNIQELVLDIVHLDADHAGASMGRKIFQSLSHRNAARNLMTSTTDNGSNNRTMNTELCKQVHRHTGSQVSRQNMSILCVCHILHLICCAILSSQGVVNITEDDDGYNIAKVFNLGQRMEESEEVLQEEARMRREDGTESSWIPDEESDDNLSDIGSDNDAIDEYEPQDSPEHATEAESSAGVRKRQPQVLNPVQKVHAIAVHCTASPQRRRTMEGYIRLYCTVVLAVIKSMAIRWNTVLAELRRALLLRPAFEHYVNTLDTGLKTKKARQAAQQLRQELTISDLEWDVIEEVVRILQPFEDATRSFSKQGKPHLPDVLPTFMQLRMELQSSRSRLQKQYGAGKDPYGLIKAISAGEQKLEKYLKIALQNDSVLISSILHPGMRLRFFSDERVWGKTMRRGEDLIRNIFQSYKSEPEKLTPNDQQTTRPSLHTSWSDRLLKLSGAPEAELDNEIARFFGNVYAYQPGTNILQWWKEHELDFPILSRIARDYLGIPATSVSVERLFSQCKLVMSDYRAMSIETARRLITCKQWLEVGLGENLPNFVLGVRE